MPEYKLKGIDALSLKNGEKLQLEVEGIPDAKVLLAKVRDRVHALSSNCTHYGAPLVKGVLTGEGRLTCPWHGACFHVETGDIENAPALDPLAKYEVFEKDGGVYIRGEEEVIKASRGQLNIKCQAQGNEKVLVVGGGSGATGAIEGLRGGGYTGHITVISREGYRPIDRTKLSKALLADVSKIAWRPVDFYKDASIDIIDDEVSKIDFNSKSVSTKSGKTHDYTKLVLATGGSPRWLPLPGLKGDLGNVFVLRAIPHAKSIVEAVGDNGKKIVVIGSSFIGLEVANCLVSKGNDVTVIGMEKAPMERVMGEKVGNIFRAILEKNGIKFKMEASVEKGTPSETDPSKIGVVHLKDGTQLPADLVIEGVGVAPATEFLKDSPEVKLEADGSILTDESFAVQGLSNVYAIGDIATYPYHGPGGDGKPVRIEHWNVAQNAGRVVATAIQGKTRAEFIPIFWSALGSQMRYCGNVNHGWDDVVIVGDTQKPAFVGYYTKGETVVAVVSMGKDPYMSQASELMRRNKMPGKSEIQKGVDILEVALPTEVAGTV
ncbi:hypothetical protein P152DRAFT_475441 [Eremomyces bilateralis CBS 781.70]|uniref:Rieske domain-containing protein n=1 Tax=Eremomyces bilateralis CBS 781.70 TaxID=1392243 RepID=A0A6G1FY39_9PEZI|nr:uncharacterized protein P152DRAFT_475441 [Eremomyces bilateralis CBS 781.70]KAF1810610.1 hypothetical protein P152DRAFT_475441 [Eremomyces bilateralis CBS 781.70]